MCSVSPAVLRWDLITALKCPSPFTLLCAGDWSWLNMAVMVIPKVLMLGREYKPGISDPGSL